MAADVGCDALASVDRMPTLSVAVGTRYQFESTAYTVMGTTEPAVCVDGDPDLPFAVPGAKVSPGASAISFANGPVTRMPGVELAVIEASVTSEAVTIKLPCAFSVTLKFLVPDTSAASAGSVAVPS